MKTQTFPNFSFGFSSNGNFPEIIDREHDRFLSENRWKSGISLGLRWRLIKIDFSHEKINKINELTSWKSHSRLKESHQKQLSVYTYTYISFELTGVNICLLSFKVIETDVLFKQKICTKRKRIFMIITVFFARQSIIYLLNKVNNKFSFVLLKARTKTVAIVCEEVSQLEYLIVHIG